MLISMISITVNDLTFYVSSQSLKHFSRYQTQQIDIKLSSDLIFVGRGLGNFPCKMAMISVLAQMPPGSKQFNA